MEDDDAWMFNFDLIKSKDRNFLWNYLFSGSSARLFFIPSFLEIIISCVIVQLWELVSLACRPSRSPLKTPPTDKLP